MTEMNEINEMKTAGLEIQSAILHILDGSRHRIILSEMTMNLEDPQIEKYVRRYVTRCRNDMRSKPGTFLADSSFQEEMQKYFRPETDLPGFTAEVPARSHMWRRTSCSAPSLKSWGRCSGSA